MVRTHYPDLLAHEHLRLADSLVPVVHKALVRPQPLDRSWHRLRNTFFGWEDHLRVEVMALVFGTPAFWSTHGASLVAGCAEHGVGMSVMADMPAMSRAQLWIVRRVCLSLGARQQGRIPRPPKPAETPPKPQ
jgi:hypothetical protein